MCGIAGIIEKKVRANPGLLRGMADAMEHRGPDAEGYFVQGPVGLAHRRLRIIDLEGGRQPLFNEDGTVGVVYNGEIYNFLELKQELERRGHRFRTHCDTEVIAHAYEEYGEDCPKHFRGMFAFAVHDTKNGRTFLARDRLGVKPLYYYEDDERFLFASEVKPILKGLEGRRGVNTGMLDFYLSVGYVPGNETLFAGIHKLLPGHSLTIQGGKSRQRPYWDLGDGPVLKIGFEEACEQFEKLLMDCVRMRLMSEVPLGAFLSGGLDSSAVVACMSRLMKEPVKTFSVGYKDDPESNELGYARKVAEAFKTDHHEFVLEPQDFFDSIDLLLTHAEEPIVESAAVALCRLSELARKHVTVILSGEGADEALCGYPLYQIMGKVDRLHGYVKRVPALLQNWIGPLLGGNEKRLKYWDWARLPLADRYQSIPNDVTDSIKKRMYRDDFNRAAVDAGKRAFRKLFDRLPNATPLRKMSYVDIKTWLPEDLLLKADKMTMAHSLELRVPFLDYKLVEFCMALPDAYRLNGDQGKFLLKKVMEKHLPSDIIYRKKKGFPVPIAVWLRGSLYEKAREVLLDRKSLARGYFKPEYVESVLKRHKSGGEDLSRRIFSLLVLEMWHRKYIDG